MHTQNFIIAIDGFSSCGKSTLAKQLAKHFNYTYVDSGAMYRAITLHFINNNIDLDDEVAIIESVNSADIRFENINGSVSILLNDQDVSEEIREMHVANKVSKISPISAVRTVLVANQQKMATTNNIVMDGRDIGTQVFPFANVKLFMTAEPKKRAERRFSELSGSGKTATLEEVFANLTQRDHDDTTRKESPLVCATDAIVIDNTHLSMDQQFDLALEIIRTKAFPKSAAL
ncbi:cytidylate kinase [Pedobacter sp. UYP24]